MQTQTQQELKEHYTSVDYTKDLEKITSFLLFFTEGDTPKYLQLLKTQPSEIHIYLKDVLLFDESGLYDRIIKNTMTYLNLFYKAIDSIIFDSEDFVYDENMDPMVYHRIARLREKDATKKVTEVLPTGLLRNYDVYFIPTGGSISLKELKSCYIGKLVKIRGIITKVTEVKPSAKVLTYVCESCGSEIYQQIFNDAFDLLEDCPSEKCKIKNTKGVLHLQTRGCKFTRYQGIKIQELSSDTAVGCIPKIINVECYNKIADSFLPGELVEIGGIFMPRPFYGFKKMKAGLIFDTYFYCLTYNLIKQNLNNLIQSISFNSLINCFAPEIYGMDDVKKILFMQLVGAPDIKKKDGMKIRGNINVLLLGDPGIAKSQLLKTVTKIAMRSVYTTGKGTSGVGLTASVTKDALTNDLVLEGGALVLSDKGICCIDELDKMDENDRVALHEVMEQQTISISKAGINTTLNARCGILGAANPIKGKYNVKRSVEWNIGLPSALISRFDVLMVLKDEANAEKDLSLASHVTNLHIVKDTNEEQYAFLTKYIEECKNINPILDDSLKPRLTDAYVIARQENNRLTPRYLLSLVRLTLSHARLRKSEFCTLEDVNEAIRLIKLSYQPKIKREKVDKKYEIYNTIVNYAKVKENFKVISYNEVVILLSGKYTENDITECINEFEKLGVWVIQEGEIVIFN
ncbi:hypothetical protein H312_02711 [Anncaliia algerae PRA339]|uniref:DNA replication licensing factor MCM7 n=1 Tax=Anncaliia algerae PRA339 TaxID=1288291 RepID=A0A059EYT0_9MICR|nr:hypothetical protein H312_02711 [Anncaliia algerae PRA339]